MLNEGLDTGRAAEHGFQIRKDGKGIEIGMHEGEIFDIRQNSGIGPDADLQIGKLFPERVAPCLGVADMFVEIHDEQRHNRLLSYSIGVSIRPSSIRLFPRGSLVRLSNVPSARLPR